MFFCLFQPCFFVREGSTGQTGYRHPAVWLCPPYSVTVLFPYSSRENKKTGSVNPASCFEWWKVDSNHAQDSLRSLCAAGTVMFWHGCLCSAFLHVVSHTPSDKTKNQIQRIWLLVLNGGRWIRTTEGGASRFTVCPLWPLGNSPK